MRKTPVVGASTFLATLWLASVASCSSSSSTSTYTPFTGIRIDSASLVSGYACGRGSGQVYKYVAVVRQVARTSNGIREVPQPAGLPTANVFDCTADSAAFSNLPAAADPEGGVDVAGTPYGVRIYAYTADALPSDLSCTPGACTPPSASANYEATAVWTTTCLALQESGDNALAVCQPLQLAQTALDAQAADATDAADATSTVDSGAADAAPAPSG